VLTEGARKIYHGRHGAALDRADLKVRDDGILTKLLNFWILSSVLIFAYFPKVGLCDHHTVCVPFYCPYQLLNAWTNLTKLGMYITAPQPISTAYFINPSHQSVCLYESMCISPIVARQRLGKHVPATTFTRDNKRTADGVSFVLSVYPLIVAR
jgi:hypothetical protein